ncbi:MAG: polysaccharide biosynthesis protein [Spirochaetales bacterium]|jgi:FlaA1/EpsC-like NDP-sugar epimerase|nr:polysaccharide biosynthesis protein [Spirochaetales bacterium]
MADRKKHNRIYIIGAGFAGTTIASELRAKGIFGEVVAFLDDDDVKIGTHIGDIPVLGPIKEVVSLLRQMPADEALIAMPSAPREKLRELYQLLQKAEFAKIRILPGISQIMEGAAHLIQAREIDPQDLLARSPVTINLTKSLSYLRGKRVLITGAGGSIGSELSRQLLSGGASRLYLFGHGENSIYEIDRELRILQEEGVGEKATIVPVIGDLKDEDYMRFILPRLKTNVIFHCAAYKHVPMSEANPVEAIRNNVFGTRNLVEAAAEAGTQRFVFISTDKAVGPSSVYGASKKIAEEIVLSMRARRGLDFIVVRFGNVLGSRGSIVPLFQKQILKGGPLTITHPDVSRFFMTIPEAASLVLQAGGVGEGGNLYVLDMGDPLSIKDLAEQMIRFYGFEPEKDIPIVCVGLRPGEKLTEDLWDRAEKMEPTRYRKINRIIREGSVFPDVDELLEKLKPVCFRENARAGLYRNRKVLREILSSALPNLEASGHESEY